MYDASTLPLEENIRKTAAFVKKRGKDILIEGACDEIVDATGSVRNALTTPEHALPVPAVQEDKAVELRIVRQRRHVFVCMDRVAVSKPSVTSVSYTHLG